MSTILDRLQNGLKHHQQGRMQEAARLYESVLESDPNQPDALHLLGLVYSHQQAHAEAIALIQRALIAAPQNSIYHCNLGVVTRLSGDIEGAIVAYRQALALDPQNADAHYNLGKSLKLSGNNVDAEAAFRAAIAIAPQKSSPWLSLMNLCTDRRDMDSAVAIGIQALQHCPNSSELQMNLGAVYRRAKQPDAAISCYQRAIELDPNNVDALCRLASSFITRHQLQEGQKYLERATRIEPKSVHVIGCQGLLHNTLGNSTAAVALFREALSQSPGHGTLYANLGSALRKLGDLGESLEAVQKGLHLEPNSVDARVVEGGILMSLGRLDDAERSFREAISLKEGYREAHQALLMCMHYQTHQTAQSIYDEHCEWSRLYARSFDKRSAWRADTCKDRNRPLRLGFVSADLGAHPVGYFTVRMFEALDREKFSTYVYSDRVGKDWLSERIKQSVFEWQDTAALSDNELFDVIGENQIDILFDLSGHTAQNRLLVFARRAAPVQISWAGYVGTTGLPTMDYLLADRFHLPEDLETSCTERVLCMPHGYVTYCAPPDLPAVQALPAIEKGYVTYGSMCNPAKVNSDVLQLWKKILLRVDESRLVLSYSGWPDAINRERVLKALGPEIAEERIGFRHQSGPLEVMKLYGEVDIALDTFPYSGGLTTIEALWMGVPTVTWPWKRFAGRHSLSHLSNVGLGDWIAEDADSYVELAIQKTTDLPNLAKLRLELRELVANSPLCDGRQFAADFASLLQQLQDETVLRSGFKGQA